MPRRFLASILADFQSERLMGSERLTGTSVAGAAMARLAPAVIPEATLPSEAPAFLTAPTTADPDLAAACPMALALLPRDSPMTFPPSTPKAPPAISPSTPPITLPRSTGVGPEVTGASCLELPSFSPSFCPACMASLAGATVREGRFGFVAKFAALSAALVTAPILPLPILVCPTLDCAYCTMGFTASFVCFQTAAAGPAPLRNAATALPAASPSSPYPNAPPTDGAAVLTQSFLRRFPFRDLARLLPKC